MLAQFRQEVLKIAIRRYRAEVAEKVVRPNFIITRQSLLHTV